VKDNFLSFVFLNIAPAYFTLGKLSQGKLVNPESVNMYSAFSTAEKSQTTFPSPEASNCVHL
jgi:hypothetical protein